MTLARSATGCIVTLQPGMGVVKVVTKPLKSHDVEELSGIQCMQVGRGNECESLSTIRYGVTTGI